MRRIPESWEQRRAYRIGTPGTSAVCRGADFISRYVVANLSTTGALLTAGAPRPIGEPVEVEVMTADRGVLTTKGRVARTDRDGICMAVIFNELEPAGEDTIHDLVLDALEGVED